MKVFHELKIELKRELREKGGFALAVEAMAFIGLLAVSYLAIVLIGAMV